LADDRNGPAEVVKEPLTPAMARLLEAETQADEVVGRAQKEAEEIVAEAKRRANQIEVAGSSPEAGAADASREGAELEKQKTLIVQEANRRIEMMRADAAAHLAEAIETVLAVLVDEP
jgi:vacuolar-type H+-ATPase subunit H